METIPRNWHRNDHHQNGKVRCEKETPIFYYCVIVAICFEGFETLVREITNEVETLREAESFISAHLRFSLLLFYLLRVVNRESNIWFQFVPLGVDYNLNSLLSWFKSSHPSSSSEENVYAPLHSSLIFPIMIKFVVYENFPSMSFSACKNKHFCRALQLVPREN